MKNSYYGEFGGQYVAESLMNPLAEVEKAFNEAMQDPKFIEEYNYYLKEYVGERDSSVPGRAPEREVRNEDLSEERRSEPYGRAQDQ